MPSRDAAQRAAQWQRRYAAENAEIAARLAASDHATVRRLAVAYDRVATEHDRCTDRIEETGE